jgi:hypothetical protein
VSLIEVEVEVEEEAEVLHFRYNGNVTAVTFWFEPNSNELKFQKNACVCELN